MNRDQIIRILQLNLSSHPTNEERAERRRTASCGRMKRTAARSAAAVRESASAFCPRSMAKMTGALGCALGASPFYTSRPLIGCVLARLQRVRLMSDRLLRVAGDYRARRAGQ